jgi:ribonucleoside-diphosphate reductase alpha chain
MTPTEELTVVKRNGLPESLNLEKIHIMVEEACLGLSGVSASQVEIQSGIQFYDGITTEQIQDILIRSASDLITLENPNYQYVAARLLSISIRKKLYGRNRKPPHIFQHLLDGARKGVYDSTLVNAYNDIEWDRINNYIDYERDMLFTYAGLRQVSDKYLVQDRSSGEIYESPQQMYVLIAATIFSVYPKETRLKYVKDYYDAISKHQLNLPTPIMAGVRTPIRQFASCVLIDADDTLDSIFTSDMAIGKYVAQRAGIGINAGRIRGINSKIRGGEVQHTGVVPFLKKFESTVRCCTQNGIRGGSATVHFPIWHQEIQDILVLKNNKGTEDNRVRKLDYSIQISKLFYQRFINNEDITLFSPHDVPEMYEEFGSESFDNMYLEAEANELIPKKTVKAQELFLSLLKERAETGRIYIMNIDHCNDHSSFDTPIKMSNLCQEITLPTDPLQHIDGHGEIALCILSAVNLSKLRDWDHLRRLCELSVRSLDVLIDYQQYPVKAAENSTRQRRSLGIGFIGLAHYLAKLGFKYDSWEAHKSVHILAERFQFYLLEASMQLAKEYGPCEAFEQTKYSRKVMPVDTYKTDIDEFCYDDKNQKFELKMDWAALGDEIWNHGLRNSTLTAQMPSESSSVVCGTTNGIEPPRDYLTVKKSKKGVLKTIVPQYVKHKNDYTLLWDMPDNDGYIKVVAILQKFFDQGISGNWSYNPAHYDNGEVPVSVMAQDLLKTYKYGWKTSYYQNTYDNKTDDVPDEKTLLEQILQTEGEDCDSCTI